jgi:signal transduction histidine kinase
MPTDSNSTTLTKFIDAARGNGSEASEFTFGKAIVALANAFSIAFAPEAISIWTPQPRQDWPHEGKATLVMSTLPFTAPSHIDIAASRLEHAVQQKKAVWYDSLDESPASLLSSQLKSLGWPHMVGIPIQFRSLDFANSPPVVFLNFSNDSQKPFFSINERYSDIISRFAGDMIELAMFSEQEHLIKCLFDNIPHDVDDDAHFLDTLSEVLRKMMSFEACSIFLADEESQLLRLIGTTSKFSVPHQTIKYRYGERTTGKIAYDRMVIASENVEREPWYTPSHKFPDTVDSSNRMQYLGGPILHKDKLLGVIRFRNKIPHSDRENNFLNFWDMFRLDRVSRAVAPVVAMSSGRSHLASRLRRMYHDMFVPATGIRNNLRWILRYRVPRLLSVPADIATDYRRSKFEVDDADKSKTLVKLHDCRALAELIIYSSQTIDLVDDKISLSQSEVNILGDIVAKLASMLESCAAEEFDIDAIEYDRDQFKKQIPPLFVDEDKITIVMYNLLHNAMKYSSKGTTIHITASETLDNNPSDQFFSIYVKNYGIEVSDKAAPHVFEKYYRAPEAIASMQGGAGIGLYTSRRIAKLHGGDIELVCKNTPTIFALRLPKHLAIERGKK